MSVPNSTDVPPSELVDFWCAKGVVPLGAVWKVLSGGRSNAVWRVDPRPRTGESVLVCKLYRAGGHTPLFANDPEAENCALSALDVSPLAPSIVAADLTPAGPSLVYTHVPGRIWTNGNDPGDVARALATLHREPVPAGLPGNPGGALRVLAQGDGMLREIPMNAERQSDLAEIRPTAPDVPPAPAVFIHGDATAGNVLVNANGVTFIDWQCPCRGDATEDMATFLSPAMQVMSGNRALSGHEEQAFLDAYGGRETVARYRQLKPLFHWRMAAYCLWRAARGEAGYRNAASQEITALRAAMRSKRR